MFLIKFTILLSKNIFNILILLILFEDIFNIIIFLLTLWKFLFNLIIVITWSDLLSLDNIFLLLIIIC